MITDNRLWFRAKRYGWGWTPCTWQGWAVTLADVAAVFAWAVYIASHRELAAHSNYLLIVLLPILGAVAILILICWLKGERPGWHWGE